MKHSLLTGREWNVLRSETGNAVAVDHAVQLNAGFAQRAVMGRTALIVIQVMLHGVNADDRESFTFIDTGENSADADRNAAVVADGFHSSLHGVTEEERTSTCFPTIIGAVLSRKIS